MVKLRRKMPSMVIACMLAMVMLFSTAIPAFAFGTASVGSVPEDVNGGTIIGQDVDQGKQTEYWNDTEVGDSAIKSTADVYATIPDSDIVVTVPKVIVLDGKSAASNVGTYTVKVQGDISADTIIAVEPQDEMDDREGINFEMSSVGKNNIPADVEQAQTEFSYADGMRADVAATTTGTVTAYGMTAGKWNGDFMFNINASQVESEGSEYGEAIQMWEISETKGVDDVWMTYYQPETSAYSSRMTTTEVYEGGTIYITGTGNMETGIYNHFLSEEGYIQQIINFCEDKCGYNVRYEVLDSDEDIFYNTEEKLKIYIDDETAGSQNGTEVKYSDWQFDPTDENAYKFVPTAVVIDEGVTNVSDTAFVATHITEVALPSSVKSVGETSFLMCTQLTTVNLCEGLESINNLAFGYCFALEEITIPESVTSIADEAFTESGLTTIKGVAGSYAETFANANGYTFVAI